MNPGMAAEQVAVLTDLRHEAIQALAVEEILIKQIRVSWQVIPVRSGEWVARHF